MNDMPEPVRAKISANGPAVLAVVYGDPGGEQVQAHVLGACISAVNACESLSGMMGKGWSVEDAWLQFRPLPLEVVGFDAAQAGAAAALLPLTQRFGLSLGDRACLALAQRRGLPVLTADRAWAKLRVGVEVVLIRYSLPTAQQEQGRGGFVEAIGVGLAVGRDREILSPDAAVAHRKHAELDGVGGIIASARWHTAGRPVVYLAAIPAGALVAALAHLELHLAELPRHYQLLKAEAAGSIRTEIVNRTDPLICRRTG